MFIDIHAHAYLWPCPPQNGYINFCCPEEVLARYDELNIAKGVLLPLIGPETYLPQSNEQILEICRLHPDRFIPFCNIDPRAICNSADAPLDRWLKYYRDQGCKGIGEVMPNLAFLDPMVQNLFKHVEAVGFPLIFDITDRIGGHYGLYDDAGLPQLERCLQKFPKLKILGHGPPFWAEIARLETPADRCGYPDYPLREEGVVPKLFRRYPNMYGDLSAFSGYNALARDPEYAVKFINEFHDRLLFGTDICPPDQKILLPQFLDKLKEEGKISNEVYEQVAWKNAQKILNLDE
jgi:hypothetical protein